MMATDPNCRNATLMLNGEDLNLDKVREFDAAQTPPEVESDTTNTISGRRSTC